MDAELNSARVNQLIEIIICRLPHETQEEQEKKETHCSLLAIYFK